MKGTKKKSVQSDYAEVQALLDEAKDSQHEAKRNEEKAGVITPSNLPKISYAEFLKLKPRIFEAMEKVKEKLDLKEIPLQSKAAAFDMTHDGRVMPSPFYCSFMMRKAKESLEKWPSDSQGPALIATHVVPVVAFLFSAIIVTNSRPELSAGLPPSLYEFKVEILNLGEDICLLFDKDLEIFKAKINFGYQKAINYLTFKRFNDEQLLTTLAELLTLKFVDVDFMFDELNLIYQIMTSCIAEFDNFAIPYKERLLTIVFNFLKRTIDTFSSVFNFIFYRVPAPELIYAVFMKNTILTIDFLLSENHEESASLMSQLLQIIANSDFKSGLLSEECCSVVLPALFSFANDMTTHKKMSNEILEFIITATKAFTPEKPQSSEVVACLTYLKSFAEEAVKKQEKDNKESASSQKPKTPSVSEPAPPRAIVTAEPSKQIKKQIEALQQQNKDVKGSSKRLNREVQDSKKANKKLQESLDEKDRALKDSETALENERAQLRSVKWQKTVLERQLEESAQRVTDTSADLAEVQAALEQRDAALQKSKEKDLGESQQKALEKDQQIAALREQLQTEMKKTEEERSQRLTAQAELKKSESEKQVNLNLSRSQFASFTGEVARLTKENAELTKEVERLTPKPSLGGKPVKQQAGRPNFSYSSSNASSAGRGKTPGPSSSHSD